MSDNDNITINQINEQKYVLELKHFKQGSALILGIGKLKVSGDDLSSVISELKEALDVYLEMEV
tara:strand:- start:514 stop:705 length:192 start_codon:yes stop_codon:yes gene_type:complete